MVNCVFAGIKLKHLKQRKHICRRTFLFVC